MTITYINYKVVLPESLWEKFINLATNARGRSINYISGCLTYDYN